MASPLATSGGAAQHGSQLDRVLLAVAGDSEDVAIRLGPARFADDETLAATIAQEHTHVLQQVAGQHLERPLKDLEDEAYASEVPALERYRNGPS